MEVQHQPIHSENVKAAVEPTPTVARTWFASRGLLDPFLFLVVRELLKVTLITASSHQLPSLTLESVQLQISSTKSGA